MMTTSRNYLLIFALLFLLVGSVCGQTKFEYGIGIGINHSKIKNDLRTQFGQAEPSLKGIRLPSIYTRLGYKFNNRFHLNSGLGFSWLGAFRKDVSARIVASTFEMPVQLEWNPNHNIHLASGMVYNYIIGIEDETEKMKNDLLPSVNSRHQVGLRHGIAYSYNLIELSLSYTHHLSNLWNFNLTDVNGNVIGSQVSKFRNIQIGITFRR